MSNITVSRREAGDGAKPYVVLIDGQPWLDRQNHPRRFGDSKRAWNAAYKRFARQLAGAIQAQAEAAALEAQAPEAVPAPSRPYGCIDPADKLTHADVRRIGLKPGPAPLTPEQVEAAYAARAEARAHARARAKQAQAAPLQDGPGAELRRQAAELRCSAGYADDYRAYLADLDAAAALEARARQLEIQAAAPAPGPAAIPTEPDHDTGAQPMTPNTDIPHPSMASTIAAQAAHGDTVQAGPAQAPRPTGMTFAESEQLAALQLAAHIDEIESYEGFELFIRGYFTQGTYNLLKYTNTLRALWDARHPQRPEPAPDDMAGIRKALDIIKRGDPMPEAPAPTAQATKADATRAIATLEPFVGRSQLAALGEAMRGEEKQFFFDKLVEWADLVTTMPKTYDQDGLGDQAVVHLHYFRGSADWYITERDSEPEQLQAFGLADLGEGYPELGYIGIAELIGAGVELDLHWQPKTLAEIRQAEAPAALADPAPVHSKARWHEGFADGDAGREPTHDVADYRSGWNHGAVCRAQREAAEAPGVEGVAPALVAVYGGSDMTEGEFSTLADQIPESATVADVIEAATALRGNQDAEGEPEAPADKEKDAPIGEPAQDSGTEAIEAETGAGAPAPVLPSYGALLAEYHRLAHAVAQLSDRLAAAESIIEALRGPAPARPAAPPAEPPAPKPATPRAAVDVADSAPYKRGFAAARKGGKADADWFNGYGLGTADKAEGRASRDAQMAGRSLRSGYVAGFTGANETTNTRWVAGYKAGLRG